MRESGWDVRSLLNKEDPVGIIQQNPPNIFIISHDFGRQKDLGILRAVQRFRDSGMKIVALFEDSESEKANGDLCDFAFSPPWRTAEMRDTLSTIYTGISGKSAAFAAEDDRSDDD